MITILGAGGVTSNEVAKLLAARKQPFRLVGRHPVSMPGAAEVIVADLSDKEQTLRAVEGSSAVYLLAGLKYDHKLWAEMWPRIMANTIEACKRAGAKLIFFDNVYMYGKVNGAMTEETPFNPSSRKGEVRAKIASSLIDAWKAGNLTAMIARSADFYGPGAQYGIPNALVFEPFQQESEGILAGERFPAALVHLYPGCGTRLGGACGKHVCVEPNLAPAYHGERTSRERVDRPRRTGNGRRGKIPCLKQADGARGGVVQSAGWRNLRDALPERFAVPLRFFEVRASLRLCGNAVCRGDSRDCGFLQKRALMRCVPSLNRSLIQGWNTPQPFFPAQITRSNSPSFSPGRRFCGNSDRAESESPGWGWLSVRPEPA